MISTKRMLLAALPFLSLLAWLNGSRAANKRRFTNMIELRKAVMDIMRRKPHVSKVGPDPSDLAKIEFQVGGRSYTADLTNLINRMRAYPDDDQEQEIAEFAEFAAAMGSKRDRTPSTENLVLVFRDKDYLDQIRKSGPLTEPFAGELTIVYMADMPDSMSAVTLKEFPGRDVAELREIAIGNVRKWLGHVKSDEQLQTATLYFVEGNTMLSPTLILLDEFWASIRDRYPGDTLIAVPRRDQLFILNDNAEGLALARRVIDVTLEDDFAILSNQIFARRNGRIVLVGE